MIPFDRSIRSLEGDSWRHRRPALLAAAGVLALWFAWFFLARLPVTETTENARVEVRQASHGVDAVVEGRVVHSRLAIGRWVTAGQILVELDATEPLLASAEARARLQEISIQRHALEAELRAEESAVQAHDESRLRALDEARARSREVEVRAALAAQEARRLEDLARRGLTALADLSRVRAEADASDAQARAQRLAAERLDAAFAVERRDRAARIAAIRTSLAELDGSTSVHEAALRRLQHESELRTIRAPVSGRIGEAHELRPGSVVKVGQRLGSVVPRGDLHVVGFFPRHDIGRLQVGQRARLRLHGYPWTRFGTIDARVTSIGTEPAEGIVRVELVPAVRATAWVRLEHGLGTSVDIEIERVSPCSLLLGLAAKRLDPRRDLNAAEPRLGT